MPSLGSTHSHYCPKNLDWRQDINIRRLCCYATNRIVATIRTAIGGGFTWEVFDGPNNRVGHEPTIEAARAAAELAIATPPPRQRAPRRLKKVVTA